MSLLKLRGDTGSQTKIYDLTYLSKEDALDLFEAEFGYAPESEAALTFESVSLIDLLDWLRT